METWKKVLSVILCIALSATLLTGCGTSTPPASDGAADTHGVDGEGPFVLRFSWWGTQARHEATLAVIEAFMDKYPNVIIEPEYGDQEGYNEKKAAEFANHTAPDIFQIETGAGPEYCSMGVLYNLSTLTFMKFDKFDSSFLEKNGQFGTGSQYAIPTGTAGSALIVNHTLARQIGIDFTQQYDWEKLIEWGEKVQAYDPSCYLLSANTHAAESFFLRCYARQLNGVPLIDDASKTLNVTEEQFTQMFEYIDRLYKTKTCAPASVKEPYKENKDQEDPNWINGKYVASVGFTSNAQALKDANPDAEYIAGCMPLLENRKSDGWINNTPQFIGVYAETKYPEQAALFLDFFFNTDEAATMLNTVRSIPPTAFAQKIVKDGGFADPLVMDAVNRSLSYNGFDDAGLSTSAEVLAILRDAYDAIAFGTSTPSQTAKQVVADINEFLSRL